ncbi:MAG TPA: nucleotidyltransferase family protein [Streptosporangiaceae bacterium]|nr:nucleotidyltransferase family protein [Streptosporangiaceae bacterium]
MLAAGAGRRLGRPKALVEIGGTTLASRGVELLRAGGTDPVFMVTGAVELELPGVQNVWNPDWATGMGSSLRAGLAALGGQTGSGDAVVVALVDQPLIGVQAVTRLIDSFRQGADLVAASYQGKRRNPVLFARRYWADVAAAAEADLGARGFLQAHQDLITLVECGDVGRPDDLDTADDLERIAGLVKSLGNA